MKKRLPGQTDSLCGYREIFAGNGYCSSPDKEQIFGIEPGKEYYALIKFPLTGDTLRIDGLEAGKSYMVDECRGVEALLLHARHTIARLVTNREVQPEIYKYFFVLLMLIVYGLLLPKYQNYSSWPVRLILLSIFIVFHLMNMSYLYEAYGFRYFLSVIITSGLLLILHLYLVLVLIKRRSRKEKIELREKLSRDLHDDLASTLGSISIYSNSLINAKPLKNQELQPMAQKISRLTSTALHSISDIIWMTSPRNDSLQSLISKTSNDMMELLSDAGIQFSPDIQLPDASIRINEQLRNDAHLILKEGLNNILMHSAANRVWLSAIFERNECRIRLIDNGKGFDHELIMESRKYVRGNGLPNMKKRAEESGIILNIESSSSGTCLELKFKI